MKLTWCVAVLGGLMVAAAIILGAAAGVSVAGPGSTSHIDTVACGTGWGGHTGAANADMNAADFYNDLVSRGGVTEPHSYSADCDAAVSTRRTWTWVLLGVGALLAVGGLVVRGSRSGRPVVPSS